ncbi:MAG: N-acetylmuramoyl-L-alanine amidase [Candidatus Pacearchaeota archaeon]|jgi:hypothetical protein
MAKVEQIIVHCSDSRFGNSQTIREWHIARGWRTIGYHFVILNGQITPDFYLESLNGSIECGRILDGDNYLYSSEIGAHTLGYNKTSIGICLIGIKIFSKNQINSLYKLCSELKDHFKIPIDKIIGHYEAETANGKTCPNIDIADFRNNLTNY